MEKSKELLLEEKKRLFEEFRQLNSHRDKVRYILKAHTRWVDDVLINFFESIGLNKEGFSCVAVGGYGRSQLNPYSDIDILLLVENASVDIADKVRNTLDFLYFLGYETSASVRTVEENVEYAEKDDSIRTALLDARLIYGDKKLFRRFLDTLNSEIIGNHKEEFIQKKLEYMNKRYSRYGYTVFVLEPNVKEGVGSLRDYHTLIWIGKVLYGAKNALYLKKMGLLDEDDYRKLIAGVYFLWQLRNALHFEAARKNDVLFLNIRDRIANSLGILPNKRFEASERLMRRYYYNARNIKEVVNRYLEIFLSKKRSERVLHLDDRFVLNDSLKIKKDVDVYGVFELFFYSAQYGRRLYLKDTAKIKPLLSEIAKKRKDAHLAFVFRQLLSLNKKIYDTIKDMHVIGILDRYMPEFGRVYCLTENSLYHKYTVDEHSIQALRALDELYDYDIPKTFLMRLKHLWVNLKPYERYVLRLACILHDIGKIKKEKHEVVGANMVERIADRLHLGKDLKDMLKFLVRYHLLINVLISTRDIYDPKTLEDFLSVVDTKDKLNLLVLLTYADMKAVNDNVWTSWKEDLIEALYLKALFSFENRNYDEYMRACAQDSKRKIKAILGNRYLDLIEKLPDLVFNDIRFDVMAQYIKDIKDTARNVFVYKQEDSNLARVVVYYDNKFGFFNKISGVLACLDMNIVSAKSYNLLDGKILDVFTVVLSDNTEINDYTVEDMISRVESGDFDLDECMNSKRRRFLNRLERAKLELSLQNVDVIVDNNLSDLYTVVRVYAPDRVGLVYYITKVFVEFRLQVGMFLLDTKGTVAVDTFYVVDENFKKIYSTKMIELLKSKLYEVLI